MENGSIETTSLLAQILVALFTLYDGNIIFWAWIIQILGLHDLHTVTNNFHFISFSDMFLDLEIQGALFVYVAKIQLHLTLRLYRNRKSKIKPPCHLSNSGKNKNNLPFKGKKRVLKIDFLCWSNLLDLFSVPLSSLYKWSQES